MSKDDKPIADRSQQHLANERTFLSWIRTCVALVGLGFIIAKFNFFMDEFRQIIQSNTVEPENIPITNVSQSLADVGSLSIGTGFVIFSLILILFALKNYRDNDKAIRLGVYTPKHTIMYATTGLVAALSVAIVIYFWKLPS
ncbi:MAG: DUF202 domain-containing protein [Candidatus Nitrosocosmicus sp.]